MQAIDRHAADMDAISAGNKLASLHVPVLLLHGAADDVIPDTELLWLEKDVPTGIPAQRAHHATPLPSRRRRRPPLADKLELDPVHERRS